MSATECTGMTARWCPLCGTCSCDEIDADMSDPGCLLHAPNSRHAEELRSREDAWLKGWSSIGARLACSTGEATMTELRERPLNCTTVEVRAFLAGSKTQLRRPIVPQLVVPAERPLRHARKHSGPYFDAYCGERKTDMNPRGMSDRWCWWTADDRPILPEIQCPFGKPGDRLWCRESFALRTDVDAATDLAKALRYIRHRADRDGDDLRSEWHDFGRGWRSSATMPRWASRLTLEVVNVHVHRVKEIDEADARAEGCRGVHGAVGQMIPGPPTTARANFEDVWNLSYGKRAPWSNNPYVWAATVRIVDQRTP